MASYPTFEGKYRVADGVEWRYFWCWVKRQRWPSRFAPNGSTWVFTGWIDALIPLFGGVLMLFVPRLLIRGDSPEGQARLARFNRIGRVLLVISGVYILVKLASMGGS